MARPTRTGGKKSEAKSRNASPAKGRKTTKTQARIAPSATRVRPRSISDLSKDLKEAREQQAATAEILRVIASSPSDVQPVFDAIADSAKCLIGGFSTAVHRVIDDIDHLVAFTPTNAESDEALKAAFPRHRSEMPAIISLVENGETAQIVDSETADGQIRKLARARGWRSATYTPLMNQGTFIGFIVCTRREKGMLADHHVQLLRIFADQAVIAVENTRLFNETKEALEQQTATADVLKVISRSVFDLTSVMDTLTSSAAELCKAEVSALYLREGDVLVARGVAHADVAQVDFLRRTPLQVDDSTYIGRTFQTGAVRNIADVATESETGQLKRFGEILGFRSIVFVPLMRESRSVGIFALARMRTGQFSQREVELAQTFADQAVIAIENTRLFNETKEALERQTATSEVLEVISGSPGDLQPVFNAMLNNALRICEAKFGQLLLFDGTGFLAADLHNSPADYGNLFKEGPLIPGPNTGLGRLIATKTAVHIHDVVSGSLYAERDPLRIATVDILQARTLLAVPMLKDAELVGAVIIYRQEVRPFSDRQIELVTNFAAQGAIALENTRLLKELRGRTDDLSELLEQQTATSEVLEVISASTGELEPVFRKMLENATRICGANFGALSWYNAGSYQNVALYNIPGAFAEQMLAPIHPHPKSGLATIAKTLQVVQIEDLRTQPPYLEGHPAVVAISDLAGARTIVNRPDAQGK